MQSALLRPTKITAQALPSVWKYSPKRTRCSSLAQLGVIIVLSRFGFYTMMAILVLFLQAKFGLNGKDAGLIYSVFYALIYILALVGGLIADKTRNYKGTIMIGIITMAVGYFLMAIPTPTPVPNLAFYLTITCIGLFVIAFGNGLFKGNLQALVGQMYDKPEYSKFRDQGFSLFYMFINVGAIFAPLFAVGMRNGWDIHDQMYVLITNMPGSDCQAFPFGYLLENTS
jgi:POT family proton-dependent oligopeptide transporter